MATNISFSFTGLTVCNIVSSSQSKLSFIIKIITSDLIGNTIFFNTHIVFSTNRSSSVVSTCATPLDDPRVVCEHGCFPFNVITPPKHWNFLVQAFFVFIIYLCFSKKKLHWKCREWIFDYIRVLHPSLW